MGISTRSENNSTLRSWIAPSPGAVKQENQEETFQGWWVAFTLLHVPLGVLFYRYPVFSTFHALVVFVIGITAVLLRPKDDNLAILIMGYIVGSEVLWRMTDARMFHEFAKYAVVVISGIGILRGYRREPLPGLPLLYLTYLLPGIMVWFGEDFGIVRRRVSFNLSGPLSLAFCSIYFAQRRLSAKKLKELARIIIAPSLATAAVSAYALYAAGSSLYFGRSSVNVAALAGGANQVSNLLALGAVFCWLIMVDEETNWASRAFLALIFIALMTQATLTFSRGGVYTTAFVIICTLPVLFMGSSKRLSIFLMLAFVCLVSIFVLIPWLSEFTGGMFVQRFTDLDSTGRWELALSEILVGIDHPLGVGVGKARHYVTEYLMDSELIAHVEYTRLWAEHGILGLLSLGILIVGAIRNYQSYNDLKPKSWIVAFLIYTAAYMGQAAMRNAAPGFLYGLTWACLFSCPLTQMNSAGCTESDKDKL